MAGLPFVDYQQRLCARRNITDDFTDAHAAGGSSMFNYISPYAKDRPPVLGHSATGEPSLLNLTMACKMASKHGHSGPHAFHSGLDRFAPIIRKEMHAMARRWRSVHSDVELDHTVIYFRCGDVFTLARHTEYGILPYDAYRTLIDGDAATTIGVVTGRTTGLCRAIGCELLECPCGSSRKCLR